MFAKLALQLAVLVILGDGPQQVKEKFDPAMAIAQQTQRISEIIFKFLTDCYGHRMVPSNSNLGAEIPPTSEWQGSCLSDAEVFLRDKLLAANPRQYSAENFAVFTSPDYVD